MTDAERALLDYVVAKCGDGFTRTEEAEVIERVRAVHAERLPQEAKLLWKDAYKNRVRASNALQDICKGFPGLDGVDVGPWRAEALAELESE